MSTHSDETYEAIGRAAMSMLMGHQLADPTSMEEYVLRVNKEDQPIVRDVLENLVEPLCSISQSSRW